MGVSEASTELVRVTVGFDTGVAGPETPVTLSASEVGAADVLDGVADVVGEA